MEKKKGVVVVRGKDPLRLAFRAREGQVGGGQRDEHPPTRVSSEGGCGGGIRTGSRLSVGIKKLVKKKKKEKEHTRARDATRLEPPVVVTRPLTARPRHTLRRSVVLAVRRLVVVVYRWWWYVVRCRLLVLCRC
jgi:hypothetical protein